MVFFVASNENKSVSFLEDSKSVILEDDFKFHTTDEPTNSLLPNIRTFINFPIVINV